MKKLFLCLLFSYSTTIFALTINHIQGNPTFFSTITSQQITNAKKSLHIGYEHTSHGSQLTYSMTHLVNFMNNGGLGMNMPSNLYAWNKGGINEALDLDDGGIAPGSRDLGYYPLWYDSTTNFLETEANSNCNVIIWSWCGQVPDKYANNTLVSEYLNPMADLENKYPDVTFVYMTGHADHSRHVDLTAGNQIIREFCVNSNRVLYDFYDIESYDPDGIFYEFPNDDCRYYSDATGNIILGNWGDHWQTTHVEGVEWYEMSPAPAHTRSINGNMKAYAAWALWVSIAAVPEPIFFSALIFLFLYKNFFSK